MIGARNYAASHARNMSDARTHKDSSDRAKAHAKIDEFAPAAEKEFWHVAVDLWQAGPWDFLHRMSTFIDIDQGVHEYEEWKRRQR